MAKRSNLKPDPEPNKIMVSITYTEHMEVNLESIIGWMVDDRGISAEQVSFEDQRNAIRAEFFIRSDDRHGGGPDDPVVKAANSHPRSLRDHADEILMKAIERDSDHNFAHWLWDHELIGSDKWEADLTIQKGKLLTR